MNFGILMFVILFALPMAFIILQLPPGSQQHVAAYVGAAAALFALVLLAPRLLRGWFRRRPRTPSPAALASLDWPASLTRDEMETYCAAWLRSRGWQVSLTTDPGEEAHGVYLMASRASATLAVLCDTRGEELNLAIVRAFALSARNLAATHPVLLTLSRGKLPPPAQAAARQAGVRLLPVADLMQVETLAPAADAPLAAA